MKFNFSSKKELISFLEENKSKKMFILSGKKSYYESGIEPILKNLLNNNTNKFYFKTSPYPEFNELIKIISEIIKFAPDLIISIGGGSVIDYTKIANTLYNNSELDNKIKNDSYFVQKKFAKLCVIPTTAGSGAEVTSNAVIYINKVKYSVESNNLIPDFFFLIPEIVSKAPGKIKSSAGFDTISQAIESIISKKSNDKSVDFARRSLEISLNYFIDFLVKPNLENSSAMCFSSNLSGKAICISKTTAPHAISYPFTSLFGISHGHAVSLTLGDFLKFNYNNISNADCNFDLKKRFDLLFRLTNSKNITDMIAFIDNLKLKSGLESNFKNLGIDIENDYSKIISGVNTKRLQNNPVKLRESDIRNILLKN